MIKNYIFDLYGTLLAIRTDEYHLSFWRKMCKVYRQYGIRYKPVELRRKYADLCLKEERLMSDRQYPEINLLNVFSSLLKGKRGNAEEIATLFRASSRLYCFPYENTITVLEKLKKQGKKIYLLSNAQHVFTMKELEDSGLIQYFDGIYISSDYGIKKPDPAFMEILLEKESLKKEECVMIGNDFDSDIATAQACGMKSIFLNTDKHDTAYLHKQSQNKNVRIIESGDIREILKEEEYA